MAQTMACGILLFSQLLYDVPVCWYHFMLVNIMEGL